MALSEKEKDWLERREKYLKLYCQHCQFFEPYDTPHVNPGWCSGDCWCCPVVGKDILYSFQDAAEFEARVQKWLMYQYEKAYQCKEVSGGFLPDRGTMLMFARLAAEDEMDK